VAFLTAYYGLNKLAGLIVRPAVLIHAAAGGLGQAAVQLAQQAGAEIYATPKRGETRLPAQSSASGMSRFRVPRIRSEVLKATGDAVWMSFSIPG